jgi:hypothetical protein
MRSFCLPNSLKNSATVAALLLLSPGMNANSAEVVSAPHYYCDAPTNTSWSVLPKINLAGHSLGVKSVDKSKNDQLTIFGLRLLALRKAAIAAGMQPLGGEQIMDEFRAAREA